MTYQTYLINRKLDAICKRIDELHEGLAVCKDPILHGNLLGSISILIEQQSQLSKQLNNESNKTAN